MSDQSREDELAIRSLLERYCEGVNQRDAAVWGSTWAEDAVWELPHLGMDGLNGRPTNKFFLFDSSTGGSRRERPLCTGPARTQTKGRFLCLLPTTHFEFAGS